MVGILTTYLTDVSVSDINDTVWGLLMVFEVTVCNRLISELSAGSLMQKLEVSASRPEGTMFEVQG